MADIEENASWDAVIEHTRATLWDAGADGLGPVNAQARALVNRTLYLKEQADQQGTDLEDITSSFSQHLAAPNPHPQYVLGTAYDAQVATLQTAIDELKNGLVWQEVDSDFDADLLTNAITRYRVDTTGGAVAAMLPSVLTDGQTAQFVDQGDNWDENPLYLVAPADATYTLEGAEPYTGTNEAMPLFAASGLDYGVNGVPITLSPDQRTASVVLGGGGAAEQQTSGARIAVFNEHYSGKRWLYCTLTATGNTSSFVSIGDKGPADAGTFGVMLADGGLFNLAAPGAAMDAAFASGDSVLLEFDFDNGSLRIVTAAQDVTSNNLVFDALALDTMLDLLSDAAAGETASALISTDANDLPAWAVPDNNAEPFQVITEVALQAAPVQIRGSIAHMIYDASSDHVVVAIASESSPLSKYLVVLGDLVLQPIHIGKVLYIKADSNITLPALADYPGGFEFQIAVEAKGAYNVNLLPSGTDPVRDNETSVLGDASVAISPDGQRWLAFGEVMVGA